MESNERFYVLPMTEHGRALIAYFIDVLAVHVIEIMRK